MSANLIRRSLSTVSRRSILTRSTLSRSRTAIRSPTFATMNPDHVSELAKQEGGSSKGSPAAQAQSQMTKEIKSGQQAPNLRSGGAPANTQSQGTRDANFQEAVDNVVPKMENEPQKVTQADASHVSSAETKATGGREKGGVAAQAESLADKNKVGSV